MSDTKQKYSHLLWKEISNEKLLDSTVFSVCRSHRVSATGAEGEFVFLNSPDWVNIIPIIRNQDGEDCFIMVRQYRQGSNTITLEFPGGVLDPGEAPETGAKRELLEETGYEANDIKLLGKISPNPAFMNNWCYTYLSKHVIKKREPDLDELEFVDAEIIPIREVEEQMGEGPYINAIIMTALAWYHKWQKKQTV